MSSIVMNNINEFVVHNAEGKEVKMSDLLKQVTLIVNIDCKVGEDVNRECRDLQELYVRHAGKGFEILAFPSDQFQFISDQGDYVSAMEVQQDLLKRYGVEFPIMHKVNVNGDHADPLFLFLQKRLSGFPINAIKWDFTKFLIVDGEPTKRYAPTTSPLSIEAEIVDELEKVGITTSREGREVTQGLGAEYGSYAAVPPSIGQMDTTTTTPSAFSMDIRDTSPVDDMSKLRVSDKKEETPLTQQENVLSGEKEIVRMDLYYIQKRDGELQRGLGSTNLPPREEIVSADQYKMGGDNIGQGGQSSGYVMGSGSDSNILPGSSPVSQVAGVSSDSHLEGIKPASHFHENESVMSDLHHRKHLQEYERE